MNKLTKETFRYIECEMFGYEDTKQWIKDAEEDIREDSGMSYEGEKSAPTHKINRPTEDKAIRLVSNKQLKKARHTVHCIDKAKNRMTEDELKLFDLKYVQQYQWQKIITTHMIMAESTYHKKRTSIVEKVADEMGFIVW